MKIYGLILAGGKSSRFQGEDKSWTVWNDLPFVEHVIGRIHPQVDELLISANRQIEKYKTLGLPVISDEIEGHQGPLAGILAAMNYIKRHHDTTKDTLLLTCPCDMPLIPQNLLELLQSQDGKVANPTEIRVARVGDRVQPLTALIPLSEQEQLKSFLESGQRKAEKWILSSPNVIVDLTRYADHFYNINDEQDLQKLDSEIHSLGTPSK